MEIQKSFQEKNDQGKFYVVPTPIGNLEDITYRAIHILKTVDLIAAEDTRQTQKLLNHFSITTPLLSYHDHNKELKGEQLIGKMLSGQSIAIVSDAGMPVISDPGYELVRQCTEENIDIVVLPGANAALCALVGSGLPSDQFYFYGFLPRKKSKIQETLEELKKQRATLLFYESPHRIKETVKQIQTIFGDDRSIVLARELTKKYEEFVRGTVKEVSDWLRSTDSVIKGEYCIVVEGSQKVEKDNAWWEDMSVSEHVDYYVNVKKLSSKDAIKQTAKDRTVPKREVYAIYHKT
ncbi:16S rRNA (cytidine(1402)-2'-O)-methyltransferase [Salirhabdus salicampi]|uniref:16S rRNA (cytidine(1402)-2'-O)-methyltransferase n=1 Tax=Salirhabdus salicampi TaxID=476102 RepID=UPI0020C5B02C|nr:16S rRNA (cytidine(1402)-2'-O)-methyltransferase [Salirhabdus salicampi]